MKSSRFPFFVSRFALILALIGAILLFFHKMAFTNLILARGDTFLYFYPYWQKAAAALADGRIPLWNPDLFMGAPFLANSQVGFFYPLNWPLWLLLPTPYAVSAAILLHLLIAGAGTYVAGRRALGLSREAAWLAAILFALGGYVTAQVEHVNQLQGMAWLPWFLVALAAGDWRRGVGKRAVGFGLLWALQLLAGHTQTAFITGVGVGVFLIVNCQWSIVNGQLRRGVGALLGGGLLALGLTAVQLLPTLELAQLSSRQGGLPVNEALSFSLHPLLLGRALLPGVGQSLFSEYVAFVPLTAVLLAFIGAGQWRQNRRVRPLLAVTGLGLFLALGRFNPLYWLLAHLPGFDLFRVPARWLVWYALGVALLAGVGLDVCRGAEGRRSGGAGERRGGGATTCGRWGRWGVLALLLLMGWSVASVPLSRFVPLGAESPAEYPSLATAVFWLVELLLALSLIRLSKTAPRYTFPVLALGVLFVASRPLPYNQLTTPEAYFDVRPSIARLQARDGEPPGRFLSLSDIFFDPGDQAEIDTIYADVLDEAAQYDYTIAIKQKEIIAPNLSMAFDLAAVDGFDGGVLPLARFSDLMAQLLGVATTDGRLREHLDAVPAAKWLDLFNAQFLITDKVGDMWRDGVFFDLQHPAVLSEPVSVGYVPDFEATGLQVMASGLPGELAVGTDLFGSWHIFPERIGQDLYRYSFPKAATPHSLSLAPPISSSANPPLLQGLTLVDGRDGAFQPLVLGQYRLIHSGDVKIYENLDVLPRALLLSDWSWQTDAAGVWAVMGQAGFDPGQTAVLQGGGPPPDPASIAGHVEIIAYEPEKIVMRASVSDTAVLLLTDAFYPGWQAMVDGVLSPVYQADGLFRAILLESGEHQVEFVYAPPGLGYGRLISLVTLIFLAILLIGNWRRSILQN